MIYLSAENLSKSVPDQVLFEGLSFSLKRGDKVGLIANNGAGKSSLMKVLVGKEKPDAGSVHMGDGISFGYLEQEPSFDNDLTIKELIDGSHTDLLAVIRAYENALQAQTDDYNDKTHKAFEEASEAMDRANAWDYERRLVELLSKFGINDHGLKIGSLSGGEKKRLAMALAILDNPDLLIMDEPTNHLDVEMIEWLEKYLNQQNITLLMVTHDRYFLDRICNHILELHEGKLYHHNGNYAFFLEKRAEREEVLKTEIGKAKQLMKKELEWMRRSPKARGTKAKSRITAFYETKEKASTKISKEELKLDVKMSRVGGKILEMKNVQKAYGDLKILNGFSHTFKKGERIGIVGKNGMGKSTFLNILSGREEADYGKINVGDTTVFGYYTQSGLKIKKDQRILDILKDIADVITLGDGRKLTASQFLEYFLFPIKKQRTFYSKLSGGEQRRLHLLTVLIKNPNFLILDEPTNDLDLLTLNKLEEFLENFKGCLILVSHDRYFMDKLVDQLFIFQGEGEVKGFVGSYMDYREIKAEEEREEVRRKKSEEKSQRKEEQDKAPKVKTKLSYKEKLEYEKLEKEIEELESEKTELETKLNDGSTDYEKLQEVTKRLGDVMQLIDEKTFRWMELAEFVE